MKLSFLKLLFYSVLSIPLEKNSFRIVSFVLEILLDTFFIMVEHNFFKDQIFIIIFFQTVKFKVKVESANWITCWLIIREMELTHVGMLKSLLNSDSFSRVKGKHLFN